MRVCDVIALAEFDKPPERPRQAMLISIASPAKLFNDIDAVRHDLRTDSHAMGESRTWSTQGTTGPAWPDPAVARCPPRHATAGSRPCRRTRATMDKDRLPRSRCASDQCVGRGTRPGSLQRFERHTRGSWRHAPPAQPCVANADAARASTRSPGFNPVTADPTARRAPRIRGRAPGQ